MIKGYAEISGSTIVETIFLNMQFLIVPVKLPLLSSNPLLLVTISSIITFSHKLFAKFVKLITAYSWGDRLCILRFINLVPSSLLPNRAQLFVEFSEVIDIPSKLTLF